MSQIGVLLSGGFDPCHVGHLRMIQAAKAIRANVTIALNSDGWLLRKKGYVFMPFNERKTILQSIKGVVAVETVDDSDGTVCEALIRLKPDFFAKGGDRTKHNTPEQEACSWLGISIIWDCGGGKTQASSKLVRDACNQLLEDALFPDKTAECLYEHKK